MENAIHDRIEAQDMLALYSTRDVLSEEGTARKLITASGMNKLRLLLRPWESRTDRMSNGATKVTDISDKLKLYQNLTGSNK